MDELPAALARIVERSADAERARELVLESLTHRTWLNEHPGGAREDNQRLEYLGDAVLELVVTHALFDRLPQADEGLLSRARASAVNEGALAAAARALDLGVHLRLGRGESASGGRDRARTLADALEAVVAAAYLASGLDGARAFVEEVLGDAITSAIRAAEGSARGHTGVDVRAKDPKSVLQEIVQRGGGPPPVYVHDEPTGPVHDRTFHARVLANGRELGRGEGHSRREAEMRAASEAIEVLESSHATP
ncbi:MAG: ribonuclease III [Polyangiales bacterium]